MKKNNQTALNVLAVIVGMFGMAYASVPLYDIFCKTTGWGGTTQEAKTAPDKIYDRKIKVLFNTDVNPELDWQFKKLQDTVTVNVGENKLVFFEATNIGDKPLVGMAQYNVSPPQMGQYFVKLKCFCFVQQVITLSYTFFRYKDQTIKK
jgi:cytochrome c oxidase assembly protein subunit 11